MYVLLYVENYCSYALLNARNGKLGLLRIGAVYQKFPRVQKLESGELLKVTRLHLYCVAVLYCVNPHSNSVDCTVLLYTSQKVSSEKQLLDFEELS